MNTVLIWFRNDLRVHDNRALNSALHSGKPVIGCFIATPDQWRQHDMAPVKAQFIYENLKALVVKLSELNIPLLFKAVPDFSSSVKVLETWIRKYQVTEIHFNQEYAVNEVARDERVYRNLSGICHVYQYHDQCIVDPGSLLTQNSQPYRVFTPFSRAWHTHPDSQNCQTVTATNPQQALKITNDPIPKEVFYLNIPFFLAHDWPAGEEAAKKRLKHFVQKSLSHYDKNRDYPDLDATSGLSPYLSLGVISPRLCLQTAREARLKSRGLDGISCWINELVWREFYIHLIRHYPDLSKHRAFKQKTESIPWRQDDFAFKAWCTGQTGIPIIDAAMRQLLDRGWMHNRLRMICAMFLSKNLLIDWRRGERFFMQNLIDGHLAANNGGWQWAASTGTDSAPYFRIFNPVTQSQKFDPDGNFIKRYIPELRSLSGKQIHNPHASKSAIALDYPKPIVDLRSSRQRAINAFKSLI